MDLGRRTREYVYDKRWRIAEDGMILLTKEQFDSAQYAGMSVLGPSKGVIAAPSDNGIVLFKEGVHFVIC